MSSFPTSNPDPERKGPSEQEAARWAKLARRCGFEATVVTQKPKDKTFYGVRIVNRAGGKAFFREIGSFISWHNWLDCTLYHTAGGAIMWDKYLPSEAIYRENEIHKWIKEYKEVD